MLRNGLLTGVLLLSLVVPPALAAGETAVAVPPSAAELPSEPPAAPEAERAAEREATRRARWITTGAVGGLALYGVAAWWQGDLSSNFRVSHEGWFGQETYAGGADKLGHAYSTYLGTRLLTRAYASAGLSETKALQRAAVVSLATLMSAELIDGFSKKFRFGPEDALMNATGVGIAWLMESNPALDRLLDLRVRYRRSPEARQSGTYDPVADYSGQTYLLALKASGVPSLATVPGLRYFELVAGYGTRGYRPSVPGSQPSRHSYLGVSLNVAELLDLAIFERRGPPGLGQRLTNGVLEYLQVPGTAALHDHRH